MGLPGIGTTFAERMRSPPLNQEKRMPNTRTESSTSSSHRTTSRADSAARDEIIDQLKEDHRRVKKAFREFEKMDQQDEAACEALVQSTIAELEIHAELEEDLFYPAIRSALADEGLIDEAEVEHMTFHVLIDQLKKMEPSDDRYSATFTVLGEYIKHHVKEEEGEIFNGLGRTRMNWRGLRDDMQQLRQQRMSEQGLGPASATNGENASQSSGDASTPH